MNFDTLFIILFWLFYLLLFFDYSHCFLLFKLSIDHYFLLVILIWFSLDIFLWCNWKHTLFHCHGNYSINAYDGFTTPADLRFHILLWKKKKKKFWIFRNYTFMIYINHEVWIIQLIFHASFDCSLLDNFIWLAHL